MADYIVDREGFEFTYSAKQQKEVERIRNKYVSKEESKMEQLIRLDKQAERPGTIASIANGIIGSLILGVGMCCVSDLSENHSKREGKNSRSSNCT